MVTHFAKLIATFHTSPEVSNHPSSVTGTWTANGAHGGPNTLCQPIRQESPTSIQNENHNLVSYINGFNASENTPPPSNSPRSTSNSCNSPDAENTGVYMNGTINANITIENAVNW